MITTYNHSSLKKLNRNSIRKLAQRVWNHYNKKKCLVEINFVDRDAIISLHDQYFQKPSMTDVITFNLGMGPHGKAIGEIYICPEFAEMSAKKYNCSPTEEIARLVIHGMLHFVGFDDATREQRRQMHELENKFLELNTE